MRFKPITDDALIGCLNCSSIPNKTLDMSEVVDFNADGGIIGITAYINDIDMHIYPDSGRYDEITLEELVNIYEKVIDVTDAFIIDFGGALRGFTYELNKEDNKFYLVHTNRCWA